MRNVRTRRDMEGILCTALGLRACRQLLRAPAAPADDVQRNSSSSASTAHMWAVGIWAGLHVRGRGGANPRRRRRGSPCAAKAARQSQFLEGHQPRRTRTEPVSFVFSVPVNIFGSFTFSWFVCASRVGRKTSVSNSPRRGFVQVDPCPGGCLRHPLD